MDLQELIEKSREDDGSFSELLLQSEPFLLKTASSCCHRYITKSDDEWSVALGAFLEATKSYEPGRGSFYGFAGVIVRRRLIDYLRSQSRHRNELPVDPFVFDTPSGEPESPEELSVRLAVADKVSKNQEESLRQEIEAVNGIFLLYGFSFFDLADCSPKAKKTLSACAKAVRHLLHTPTLLSDLQKTRQLPTKILEKEVPLPRKILERHRRYIIAAVEILSGEYPCLAEYMRPIKEEAEI